MTQRKSHDETTHTNEDFPLSFRAESFFVSFRAESAERRIPVLVDVVVGGAGMKM
jgi:hypothetical protein